MSSVRRLLGLIRKESIQVLRDPSALLIAFVLPFLLLFLFAFAVSLDVRDVTFGVVVEGEGPAARELTNAFAASDWLDAYITRDRRELEPLLMAGDIRGFAVIPADFESRLAFGTHEASFQIITDGSQPNTANFSSNYARGIYRTWLAGRLPENSVSAPIIADSRITVEPRFWFNPELASRRVLLPGAIAIIMTMIGTLLTALVVAREWERGTMEALLSTPATSTEILTAKLVPYFLLGLLATVACSGICVMVFDLPLRGSPLALLLLSAVFLLPALGQGLLISALARNQFIAAQVALLSAFLPAFLLSGFLFEIASMPWPIRALTSIVAARWFVEGLQTIFLVGDSWSLLLKDMAILAIIGVLLIALAVRHSMGGLDT